MDTKKKDIIYFFMVYKNPDLVQHTIKRLSAPGVNFFMHVDANSKDDFSFAKDMDNVFLSEKRYHIRWGGEK